MNSVLNLMIIMFLVLNLTVNTIEAAVSSGTSKIAEASIHAAFKHPSGRNEPCATRCDPAASPEIFQGYRWCSKNCNEYLVCRSCEMTAPKVHVDVVQPKCNCSADGQLLAQESVSCKEVIDKEIRDNEWQSNGFIIAVFVAAVSIVGNILQCCYWRGYLGREMPCERRKFSDPDLQRQLIYAPNPGIVVPAVVNTVDAASQAGTAQRDQAGRLYPLPQQESGGGAGPAGEFDKVGEDRNLLVDPVLRQDQDFDDRV